MQSLINYLVYLFEIEKNLHTNVRSRHERIYAIAKL